MNNNVVVRYVPEEEKVATLTRKLELERKAKRRINWDSVGQKAIGILLIIMAAFIYRLIKIDGFFFIMTIMVCFFGVIAIFGSGSIYKREEV